MSHPNITHAQSARERQASHRAKRRGPAPEETGPEHDETEAGTDFAEGYKTGFVNAIEQTQSVITAMREAAEHFDDPESPPVVYVASSWRNQFQPSMVHGLREAGADVYDFRNPPGRTGFAWSSIDPDWQDWNAEQYVAALDHPLAEAGYRSDFDAMEAADTFVLVLPCGRSAHLELGWAAGAGKRTAILTRDGEEPELMAKMVDLITSDPREIESWVMDQ